MARFTMMCLGGYFRPGELMQLTNKSLIPPVPGATRFFSVLMFTEEGGKKSKAGLFNDSVLMDCPYLSFLTSWFHEVTAKVAETPLWDFDYPAYVAMFNRCLVELGIGFLGIVPYMLRHSGPSLDIALKLRTLPEAQKRGRWASAKSMNRYEREGRLGQDWWRLSPLQRQVFADAERLIVAIFGGQPHPLVLPNQWR